MSPALSSVKSRPDLSAVLVVSVLQTLTWPDMYCTYIEKLFVSCADADVAPLESSVAEGLPHSNSNVSFYHKHQQL